MRNMFSLFFSIILKYRNFRNELIEKYTYKAISKDGKVA